VISWRRYWLDYSGMGRLVERQMRSPREDSLNTRPATRPNCTFSSAVSPSGGIAAKSDAARRHVGLRGGRGVSRTPLIAGRYDLSATARIQAMCTAEHESAMAVPVGSESPDLDLFLI
jgi:hypothetical protein